MRIVTHSQKDPTMDLKLIVSLFVLGCVQFENVGGAKILAIFPTTSKSHYLQGRRLMTALAKRGHETLLLTTFPTYPNITNYNEKMLEHIVEKEKYVNKQLSLLKHHSFLEKVKIMLDLVMDASYWMFENDEVKRIIRTKEKYDAVIILPFFNEAIFGIANHIGAPLILYHPGSPYDVINKLIANPNPPYLPHPYGFEIESSPFLTRMIATGTSVVMTLMYYFILDPIQKQVLNKYLPGGPTLETIQDSVSLLLLNTHYSTETPRAYVPNVVLIGGYHIEPPKPLPKDLQEYLDSAKDGAVIFSFGSNVKIASIDKEKLAIIIKVLTNLNPIKVIFKSEIDLGKLPSNIKVSPWVPQSDILAHPNIKAFVSHGGKAGTTEAVYHAVPMVGIPNFGDQDRNIRDTTKAGYTIRLTMSELTEESFSHALNEVIFNPKYKANIKGRSELLRDQPVQPMDNAMFWIEHIIKHKGGRHLRNAGMDLYWFQTYRLDVISFFILIFGLIGYLNYRACKFTYNKIKSLWLKVVGAVTSKKEKET